MTARTAPSAPSPEKGTGAALPSFSWRYAGVVALVTMAVELVMAARYGLHRDELYFLACARHLAWGYVDQPPLVPAVAWLSTHLFGTSAVALRILPALAAGGSVLLTALMARELGGARRAQLLAALAAATSPELLGGFHLLSTTAFDLLFWAAMSFLVLRLLHTGDGRLWLAIGAVAGVGLMNKLNVGFLVAGLAGGFLLGGRRRDLWSPWLGAGVALALLIWLPNIMWNATHDWAALTMLRSLHRENGGLGASLGFIPAQLIVVGPVLVVLWLGGLRRLLASSFARPLGIAFILITIIYAISGAKTYYLGGMYFVLFAGGGVWVEDRLATPAARRTTRRWAAVMLVGVAVALPLTLPVLPEPMLARSSWEGNINKDLSATVGWNGFVRQIASVAHQLPPAQRADLVVFTGDYGAAGAVDLYGSPYGLPHAISGHNSYWWWGPAGAHDGATTIAVNLPRAYLMTIFSEVEPAGTVSTPHGIWTEERGDPIWICRGQKQAWRTAWPGARQYG